jgi:hypothetical protein
MPAIAAIDGTQKGAFTSNFTVLSADDTITIDTGKKQLLEFDNDTGGSLTCTIDGDGGTTVQVDGIGSVSVSGGLAIVVPAGEARSVVLSTIRHYCQGVVHLLGAATLKARLINL